MRSRLNSGRVAVLFASLLVAACASTQGAGGGTAQGDDAVRASPVAGTHQGGDFVAVSAGKWHTCAIAESGRLSCWGMGAGAGRDGDPRAAGQARAPEGRFSHVSAGAYHTCGVRDGGRVACWGYGAVADASEGLGDFDQAVPPEGTFSQVAVGEYHSCGLRPNGSVECWGAGTNPERDEGFADVDQAAPPAERFDGLSAGARHTCGWRDDGTVVCWGSMNFEGVQFKRAYAGRDFSCGLLQDGSVSCWGPGTGRLEPAPTGRFSAMSVGGYHACGVRADGGLLECWGLGEKPDVDELARNEAGAFRTRKHSRRTPTKYGPEDFDQAAPPPGTWRSVSAGYLHTCGIRTTGQLVCWGSNRHGQAKPPG